MKSELKRIGEEPLGEMEIELADPPVQKGSIIKRIETRVGDRRSEVLVPRHVPESGWIEIFGLPPYSEWVGVSRLEDGSENSFEDPDRNLREHFSTGVKSLNGVKIEIERVLGDLEEDYEIREISTGEDLLQMIDVEHSSGRFEARIEKKLAVERSGIHDLRDRVMGERQKEYYREIFREESLPDILIHKDLELDGTAPPVQQKFFPFWDKTEFSRESLEVLELGYLDYGSGEKDIDEVHGRWYKFLIFENFDHPVLEIREGSWESTTVDIEGEEINTIGSYTKYLYSHS